MPKQTGKVAQKSLKPKPGLVKSCGLFWLREEVDWKPGNGNKKAFHLMGRIGANRPGIRIADFRRQQGIYILYAPHGPYYVGLTVAQGLGKRLRDHTEDAHKDKWDRFSWFGLRNVGPGLLLKHLETHLPVARAWVGLQQPSGHPCEAVGPSAISKGV